MKKRLKKKARGERKEKEKIMVLKYFFFQLTTPKKTLKGYIMGN